MFVRISIYVLPLCGYADQLQKQNSLIIHASKIVLNVQ